MTRRLVCGECGRAAAESTRDWRCPDCGGWWEIRGPAPRLDPAAITAGPRSIWRYAGALPVERPLTLGEGLTPLIEGEWAGRPVRWKLDFLCPTGSYKDRGAAVLAAKLREWGIPAALEDSSGNAGAAFAAYCAAAGIRARVYVPDHASAGKLAQIGLYGAELVRVPGPREAATAAAQAAAGQTYYATHNWNPFFVAGMKTLAFELWEQGGWQPPDAVVFPAGNGSILLGLWQGFRELQAAGRISRLPRLVAVQAANAAPLYHAWQAGLDHVPPVEKQPTAAEGIAAAQPPKGRLLLGALRETDGMVVTVTEEETWSALAGLARRGLFVEPTAAVAAAALPRAGLAGTVAVVLTGSGLKATDKLLAR